MKKLFFVALLLLISLRLSAQWKRLINFTEVDEKIVAFGVAPSPHRLLGSFAGYNTFTPPIRRIDAKLLAYNLSTNRWGSSQAGIDLSELAGELTSFASLGTYFYAGTYRVYRSSDNGSNWEDLNAGAPIGSNGTFLFGTGLNVFRSADSGNTWVRLTPPRASVFGFIGPVVLVTTTTNELWRSPDNGETWATVSTPLGLPYSYAVMDSLIFGGSVGIVYSADSGATWQARGGFQHPIRALATDGKNLFAGTLDSGVWLSTDKGISWRDVNGGGAQGLSDHLKVYAMIVMDSLLFVSTTRLPEDREYMPYYNGMRSIPEMTGVGAVSAPPQPQGDSGVAIYPNPSSGIVTITSGAGKEILQVTALNILGEQALAAVSGGAMEVRLDMSKLPPGTYFLKIATKRGVTVRKIVRE